MKEIQDQYRDEIIDAADKLPGRLKGNLPLAARLEVLRQAFWSGMSYLECRGIIKTRVKDEPD